MKVIPSSRPRVKGKEEFEKTLPLVEQLASMISPTDAVIEINLVGERKMSELNRIYRGRRGAVQILTFAYGGRTPRGRVEEDPFGEIYICWPRLAAAARGRRVPAAACMLRLLAHGLCHLKGYRHDDEKNEREMEEVEKELLRGFLAPTVIARLFE